MKRLLLLGLAIVLVPVTAEAKPFDEAAIDAIVQEALKAWRVPGAAVAVVDGDDVFLKGYGVREQGGKAPVTPDTIFAIGSCSKAFTTTAIAILVEDGKVTWDDPVRKHVEFFRLADPLADREATLRDLVCHRTGMSRHDLLWYRAPWSVEETVRRIGRVEPTHSFRSTYEYNNIMYLAAGLAIGSAAKRPWNELVQQRIFEPLGMKNAVFTRAQALKSPDHAVPHLLRGEQPTAISWYEDDNQIRASGSIKTGVRDMSQWVRMQLNGGTLGGKRILSAAGLKETHRPQIVSSQSAALMREMETTQVSYGLGWRILDYRGHLLVEHGGAVDGFRAHTTLAPRDRAAVVVFCNLGSTEFPSAVSRSLLDQVFGLKKKEWNGLHGAGVKRTVPTDGPAQKRQPGTKPSREMESYAGAYEHAGYGSVTITKNGDSLGLQWSSFKLRLEHYHYDTFTTRSEELAERSRIGGEPVVFSLDASGEVGRLRFLGQEFKRKK